MKVDDGLLEPSPEAAVALVNSYHLRMVLIKCRQVVAGRIKKLDGLRVDPWAVVWPKKVILQSFKAATSPTEELHAVQWKLLQIANCTRSKF